MENKRPKIGVGIIVLKDDKVFMLKRKNSHGDGTWSFPGGHLEYMEDVIDCGKREVKEELGINIKKVKFFTITNDKFMEENKHYITIYLLSEYESGDVNIVETNKISDWGLFDWDNLPIPRFIPVQNFLEYGYNLNELKKII